MYVCVGDDVGTGVGMAWMVSVEDEESADAEFPVVDGPGLDCGDLGDEAFGDLGFEPAVGDMRSLDSLERDDSGVNTSPPGACMKRRLRPRMSSRS